MNEARIFVNHCSKLDQPAKDWVHLHRILGRLHSSIDAKLDAGLGGQLSHNQAQEKDYAYAQLDSRFRWNISRISQCVDNSPSGSS